jgi:ABC-type multidrug transport system fused ATPase/permease subunit
MLSGRRSEHFSFFDLPRTLWYFLGEERWKFLAFSGVLLIVLGYTMVPPYIVGMIANFLIAYVKNGSSTTTSIRPLLWMVGLLSGSYAAIAMIRLSSKRMLGRMSLNARYRAKVWGFERLLESSLSWHQQESTGNKAQRVLTGAEAVREWTGEVFHNFLSTVATFVGALVASILLHWAFILFFVYYLTVLIATELFFDNRISRLSDRINKSLENASGGFFESASNILSVKAMGAANSMTSNLAQREELARRLSYERLRLGNSKWMCFQIHNAMCWGMYLLGAAYMVMHGKLSAGFFLTYVTYFDKLREAAVDFTDRFQSMIERKSNLGRMMPLFWIDNRLPSGDRRFPLEWTAIHVREAVFRYDGKPAIGPLTLDVKGGEIVGITGPSGSGKSTLIKLLLGLYRLERGTLQIGDVPIEDVRHEELISNMAVVLQETELFNFSLRENITMMRDVPSAVFEQSCEIACLTDVIARLPHGLDTIVGERGYSLSGGERQRVGIARALCRNTRILLLDEATSALDSATEHQVMSRMMGRLRGKCTMLIVAHRMSTLKDADRIVVFDEGRIVEQGRFRQLAEDRASRFGAIYAIQSRINMELVDQP